MSLSPNSYRLIFFGWKGKARNKIIALPFVCTAICSKIVFTIVFNLFFLSHTLILLYTYIVARDYQDDECAILFLNIKKDRVKSILALYSVFLAFATPIKFYFDAFFKLLPYVAFSFRKIPFSFMILRFYCSSSPSQLRNSNSNSSSSDMKFLDFQPGS